MAFLWEKKKRAFFFVFSICLPFSSFSFFFFFFFFFLFLVFFPFAGVWEIWAVWRGGLGAFVFLQCRLQVFSMQLMLMERVPAGCAVSGLWERERERETERTETRPCWLACSFVFEGRSPADFVWDLRFFAQHLLVGFEKKETSLTHFFFFFRFLVFYFENFFWVLCRLLLSAVLWFAFSQCCLLPLEFCDFGVSVIVADDPIRDLPSSPPPHTHTTHTLSFALTLFPPLSSCLYEKESFLKAF